MIAIIDNGGANIASIVFALERLGYEAKLTSDKALIAQAERVILPGVGSAKPAMQRLQQLDLVDTLRDLKQPVLAICLGMQLLYEYSTEGDVPCLGIMPGKIDAIDMQTGLTIPDMGWNQLQMTQKTALLNDIPESSYVYFVHSFAAPVNNCTCATMQYGASYTAVSQHNNFFAVQFHPERSADVGEQILSNFVNIQEI